MALSWVGNVQKLLFHFLLSIDLSTVSPLHTSLRVHVQVYLLTVCPGKACIDVRTKDVYICQNLQVHFFYQEDTGVQ